MRNANAKLVASRVCNALFLALGNQETQGHADRPILWAFSYLGNGAIGKFFARKLAVTAKTLQISWPATCGAPVTTDLPNTQLRADAYTSSRIHEE